MSALEGKWMPAAPGSGGRGDLPIPGGVYIWDLKSQKMKVERELCLCV